MNLRHLIFTIVTLGAVTPTLQAQMWNGTTSQGYWSQSQNWVGNVAPLNNGTANIIFGSGETQSTIDNNDWNVNSLTFSSGGPSFSIQGAYLTVQSGIIDNSSASDTLGVVVNGPGGITVNGTGTLTLMPPNYVPETYGGPTTINAGATLVAVASDSYITPFPNPLGTSTVTLAGGTLQLESNGVPYDGAPNLPYDNSITVTASSNLAIGAKTAGHGGNTFEFGALSIGTSTLNITTNANVVSNDYIEFGATTVSGAAALASYNTDGFVTHVALDSLMVGANSLNVSTGGNLQLATGSVNLTGGSLITDGNLNLVGDVTTQASATTAIITAQNILVGPAAGGTNFATGQGQGVFTVASGSTTSGVDLMVNGNLATANPITKDGTGVLEFTSNMAGNYLNITVNAGTVQLPNTFAPLNGQFTVNTSGTLSLFAINPTTGTADINGGTLDVQTVGQPQPPALQFTSGTLIDETDTFTAVNSIATGQHLVSGSSTVVPGNGPTVYITGTFTQTGGSYTNYGITDIGNPSSPALGPQSAMYVLQGGTLANPNGPIIVGDQGSGMFIQSSGTVTGYALQVTGGLYGGEINGGGFGSYQLSGDGVLNLSSSNSYESVGYYGTGSFTQSGTSRNSVGGEFLLAENPGTTGSSYTLSEQATLSAGTESIGFEDSGTFTQTGGTNTVTGNFYLGGGVNFGYPNQSGIPANGTYTLQSGTLTAAGEYVGYNGSGTFTQSGGTNYGITSLYIGYDPGSLGEYDLSGTGTLGAVNEYVGFLGQGTFIQSETSTNTLTGNLYVGGAIDSSNVSYIGTGSYQLNGGRLSANNEYIGYPGYGTFSQSSGTNTIAQNLYVGAPGYTGGSASYTLSGATAKLAATNENINGSSSVISQSAGTNTLTGALNLGLTGNGGVYDLSGTGTLSAASENVGSQTYGGNGAQFNQTGGVNTVTGQLLVAGQYALFLQDAPTGTAVLTAGTEAVTNGGNFYQYGGTNSVGSLQVGANGGNSYYYLFDGQLQAANESVGDSQGSDSFEQEGGANSVTGTLAVTNGGTYTLLSGALSAATFEVDSTSSFDMLGGVENGYLKNFGTFTFSAGTFNGFLENDGTARFVGSFSAGQGILNNSTITVSAGHSVYGGGTGIDNEGEIDLSSSTVGGTSFLNDGLIDGYGTINGANFTNYGLVMQGAGSLTLSATGTNENFANIELASGQQFRLTGGKLVNGGSLDLDGAIVTGAATLENSTGGVISGPGSILSSTFLNDAGATIQVGAGTLNVSHAFVNSGLISLTSATANLSGPGVTNQGTIQGLGNVGSTSVTNDGILEAIGGTLDFGGAVTNQSDGSIFAGTGDKVLVSSGVATNAGLIDLTGGTYDNNGHAMTNTGAISGYGTFRTGGLTTSGSISLAGGVTTVNGAVTETGGTINTYNPTTFTSVVSVNGGAFTTHETQTVFAGGLNINGGTFNNDPGTVQTTNLTVASSGTLTGGNDSLYQVSENVSNMSTQFQLAAGGLELVAPGTGSRDAHTVTWTVNTHVEDIGTFTIDSGQTVDFENGGNSSAALYTLSFQLVAGLTAANPTALQTDISGDLTGDLIIYYDPNVASNAYLDDKTYSFGDGGLLEAGEAPEPSTWALMFSGLAFMAFWRRRRMGWSLAQ